jgi:hypothetical protein
MLIMVVTVKASGCVMGELHKRSKSCHACLLQTEVFQTPHPNKNMNKNKWGRIHCVFLVSTLIIMVIIIIMPGPRRDQTKMIIFALKVTGSSDQHWPGVSLLGVGILAAIIVDFEPCPKCGQPWFKTVA